MKTKPSKNLIEACYGLLGKVTDEQFKTVLQPALQKSMLRNPEIILETVGYVLTGLNLDLSKSAVELGKSLICKFLFILYSQLPNIKCIIIYNEICFICRI